jgi:hypothetical protein
VIEQRGLESFARWGRGPDAVYDKVGNIQLQRIMGADCDFGGCIPLTLSPRVYEQPVLVPQSRQV